MKGNVQSYTTNSGEERFKAIIDLPRTNGKRRRKSKTFSDREEADQWLVRMNYLLNEGEHFEPSEMKLEEYLNTWFDGHKSSLKQSTQDKYRYSLDNVIDVLGEVTLADLTGHHIDEFYQELNGRDEFCSTTVRTFGKVLRTALKSAVKRGLIENNPSETINLPKARDKEMDYLTRDQVDRFLEECKDHWPYEGLFTLAIYEGLRRGELMGLKWKDIDFEKQTLSVRRQLLRRWNYGFYFDTPKSKSSKRCVDLSGLSFEVLKKHKERQEELKAEEDEWEYDELVFTSMSGTILMPRNIRKNLKKHLNRSDCPLVRFHDLRHTCATLLMSEGVNVKVIANQLGHSKPSITWNRYGHVSPSMKRDAADAMDNLFG